MMMMMMMMMSVETTGKTTHYTHLRGNKTPSMISVREADTKAMAWKKHIE